VAARGFTPPYLDPAAYVSSTMTVSSDVYGVGITLFEMLSGLLIPRFDPAKAFPRLAKGLRPYTAADMTYAPHVPSTVRRLVNKATAADPAKRFTTAAEMATAVARAERSVIDWVHSSGTGLEGEWLGTWPPAKPVAQRRSYRVQSTVVAGGKQSSKRLVEAYCDTGTGWRRFGGLSEHIAASDHNAVSKFFDKVDAFVAQNRAAR
jgi:serine/threonine protein kinase